MKGPLRFFGWLLVQASLVALAVNMSRQGPEWGAFFTVLACGWAAWGFYSFADFECDGSFPP